MDTAISSVANFASSKASSVYTAAASYADVVSSSAYSSASSYADVVYSSASSYADKIYDDAANYADVVSSSAYSSAASYADVVSSSAYSSASSYADVVSSSAYTAAASYASGQVSSLSGVVNSLSGTVSSISGAVSDIQQLIPNEAAASNQLADKEFVNSSIGTNTANYIYYTDPVTGETGPFPSEADLEAYSGTVSNNDYAFVTGVDSAGNTYYDRYKATVSGSTVTWAFEYRLNNSSFTATQWAAINSGITDTLVTKIGTNETSIATLASTSASYTDKIYDDAASYADTVSSSAYTAAASYADTKYSSMSTAGTGDLVSSVTASGATLVVTKTAAYVHPTYSGSSSTTSPSPAFGGTFSAIKSVELENGHVKSYVAETVTVPNATVTTTAAGLMSAADKSKLDNIASGANKYELPTAATGTLGGIKVGTNLSINSAGVLSATDTTYGNATTAAAGLMSASDKSKLDSIASEANKYVLPTAATGTLGGIKVGTNLSINASGVLSATDTTYGNATTSAAGLMSAADKSKLDNIASGANKYELKPATTSALGGIIVGDNLTITASGILSANPAVTIAEESIGGGNVITDLSASSGVITPIKGITALTGHPSVTIASDTTSATSPGSAGTFNAVNTITRDTYGHVTKINTVTVIMPTIPSSLPASNTVDTYSSSGTAPISGKGVAAALGTLDVTEVGGTDKYITTISETDGKISATAETFSTAVKGIKVDVATAACSASSVEWSAVQNKVNATTSAAGLVSTGAQSFAGNKTFNGNVTVGGATLVYSTSGSDKILTVSFA